MSFSRLEACSNDSPHKALLMVSAVGGHQGPRHTITSEKQEQPSRARE